MGSRSNALSPCDPAIIHAITALTRDLCLVMDPHAMILEVNDEAARLYGYDAEDMVGMQASRLCAEGSVDALSEVPSFARELGFF